MRAYRTLEVRAAVETEKTNGANLTAALCDHPVLSDGHGAGVRIEDDRAVAGIENGITADALQRAAGLHAHAPITRVNGAGRGLQCEPATYLNRDIERIIGLDWHARLPGNLRRHAKHKRPEYLLIAKRAS